MSRPCIGSGPVSCAVPRPANAAKTARLGLWLGLFLVLGGCAGMRPQTVAWQALTTIGIGHELRYYESSMLCTCTRVSCDE
jgi:hypothetical protein